MKTPDAITIEILDDGTLKVTTDEISGPNHLNAEQLLTFMGRLMGGDTTKTRRSATHTHTHGNLHAH